MDEVRADVRVTKLEPSATAPGSEQQVGVTASTDRLDDVQVTVGLVCDQSLVPRFGDRYRLRLDWLDPNAGDELGAVLEAEARAWIANHPAEAGRMLDDAPSSPLGDTQEVVARRWIVAHPEIAVRLAADAGPDPVVAALGGKWGLRATVLAFLGRMTKSARNALLTELLSRPEPRHVAHHPFGATVEETEPEPDPVLEKFDRDRRHVVPMVTVDEIATSLRHELQLHRPDLDDAFVSRFSAAAALRIRRDAETF